MMLTRSVILVVMATALLPPTQSFKLAENRQIFRGDVEKFKKNPPVPVKTVYDDGDTLYDTLAIDYTPAQPTYEPQYDPYQNQAPAYDDYSQEEYETNYNPSYQDEYKPPKQVPAYRPDYQDNQRPYHAEPSYPSYEPEYHSPDSYNQYNNQYQDQYEPEYNNEQTYGNDYYEPVEVYRKKPRPTYPKEVVLLQPGPAVKATHAKHYPDGYNSGAVPGTAGKDYPNYADVPDTSFRCPVSKTATSESYYDQMYSDPETGCQVFHSCHADGRQDSFLCPLGTIFDSYTQTCDWWFNTKCA